MAGGSGPSTVRRRTALAAALVALGLGAALLLAGERPPAPAAPAPSEAPRWVERPLFDEAPLSGRVVDAAGAALAGAAVEAHSVQGSRVRRAGRATTDREGRFELGAVPVGFVAVVATADGMARRAVLVDVRRGGLRDVEIALEEGAALAGRVLNEADGPVDGARVCARSHAVGPVPELEAQCATTSADGEFALDHVTAGVLAVAVDGDGIASMLRPDVVAPTDALVLRVMRRGGLRGTIRLPDGQPASGGEVTVAGSGLWPPRVVQVADDGTYLVEDLPAGVYELEARADEMVSSRELGVEVAAGRSVTVDLDLEQGARLSGVVLDGRSGEPVDGARVAVSDALVATAPAVTYTAADGRFTIVGLAPGEHWVGVSSEGRVPVLGQPVAVPGEVTVSLAPEAVITGRVVDEGGYPVAGAAVEPDLAMPEPGVAAGGPLPMPPLPAQLPAVAGAGGELGVYPGLEALAFDALAPPSPIGGETTPARPGAARPAADRSALDLISTSVAGAEGAGGAGAQHVGSVTDGIWPVVTGPSGEFRLAGLPSGELVVIASHPAMSAGRSAPITLTPGAAVSGVEIVLRRGAEIDGRVVDGRGFPVEGVLVELAGAGTSRAGTPLQFSGADGGFTFANVAGSVTLAASRDGYAPVTVALDVPPGARRQEVEISLEEAARTVRGWVVDERDLPVGLAQVAVRAVAQGTAMVRQAVAGPDGTFEVEGMPGGLVVVEATAPGRSPGAAVAGPGVAEVTVVLEASGALVVEAVDAQNGDPIEGCTVELLAAAGARRQQPCAGGTASFGDVPAGPARVWVRDPGRATAEAEAEVAAGAGPADPEAAVRVELVAATRVVGVVLDADGEPVVGARVSLGPLPTIVSARTRGAWVESGALGRFELEGLATDTAATVFADHPSLGRGQVAVGPTWPGEEPEVEIWLDPEAAPARGARFVGVAVDLVVRRGLVVAADVAAGSRAEAAGLRPGDEIVAVNGTTLRSPAAVARALRGPRNTALLATVRRGDQEITLLIERELVIR